MAAGMFGILGNAFAKGAPRKSIESIQLQHPSICIKMEEILRTTVRFAKWFFCCWFWMVQPWLFDWFTSTEWKTFQLLGFSMVTRWKISTALACFTYGNLWYTWQLDSKNIWILDSMNRRTQVFWDLLQDSVCNIIHVHYTVVVPQQTPRVQQWFVEYTHVDTFLNKRTHVYLDLCMIRYRYIYIYIQIHVIKI